MFFVAHDHVETPSGTKTVTSPGTEANPCRIYCVNRAGSVPPVSADLRTTAQIGTIGTFVLTLSGSVSECYGIIFSSQSTSASGFIIGTVARSWRFINCQFVMGSTNAGQRVIIGTAGALTVLENCTVTAGVVGQSIVPSGRLIIRNTTASTFVSGATIPTILFSPGANQTTLFCEGLDLSNIASGKSLVLGTASVSSSVVFKDCKLGASVGIISGTVPAAGATDVMLVRCDSGDTNYRTERHNYLGTQTVSTTIYRTGGASDGTTTIAWAVAGSANAKWGTPFESLPISFWNETIGSAITVTIEGNWAGLPGNKEIWIDVVYLGTSGFPIASKATSTTTDGLATLATYPAGSGTWVNGTTIICDGG